MMLALTNENELTRQWRVMSSGTVVVHPEAVVEKKRPEFKGPEWKTTKKSTRGGKDTNPHRTLIGQCQQLWK